MSMGTKTKYDVHQVNEWCESHGATQRLMADMMMADEPLENQSHGDESPYF